MRTKTWTKLYIFIPIFILFFIFSFNFIIDPYSLTSYNILKIPNKFARDDRKEKVAKLYNDPTYNNIMLGSSRVYSINPLMVSKYLGGNTYNTGVGTARIEDHLGFLLYLERLHKLPKNIILGLDFYSFNQQVETNSYFLLNQELNFLQKSTSNDLYFNKFLSIDATRASYKTLNNFLSNSKEKPRFNQYGSVGETFKDFTYYPKVITNDLFFDEKSIHKSYLDAKTIRYSLSKDRVQYLRDIISLCNRNKIDYTFFITPLNGQLLSKIQKDEKLFHSLLEFKRVVAEITPYFDFLTHNLINDNRIFFGGDAMHTTPSTGNLILARLFHDPKINLPQDFGIYIPKKP